MESRGFQIEANEYQKISGNIQDFFEEIIKSGQKQKQVCSSIDPTEAHFIIWGCCTGMLQFIESKEHFIKDFHKVNKEQLIATYASIISTGLLPKK